MHVWSRTGDNTALPLMSQPLFHPKTRTPSQCMYPKSIPKKYANKKLLNIPLNGKEDFNSNMNKEILTATTIFLKRY